MHNSTSLQPKRTVMPLTNGARLVFSSDIYRLFNFNNIRYCGEVKPGDIVDLDIGYVVRDGIRKFKIHCSLALPYEFDQSPFFVHPGTMLARLPKILDKLEKHYETFTLPRWQNIIQILEKGEKAHFQITKDYYSTFERTEGGLSLGNRSIECGNITNSIDFPTPDSLRKGKQIKLLEIRLMQINTLRNLIDRLVLEHIVMPQLPKKAVPDEIITIKIGCMFYVFQGEYQGSSNWTRWNLLGKTRKYSKKDLDKNDG